MICIVVAAILIINILLEFNILSRRLYVDRRPRRLLLTLLASSLVAPSVTYSIIATLRERSGLIAEQLYPVLVLLSPVIHLADSIRFVLPFSIMLFGLKAGLLYSGIAISRALMRMLIHVSLVRIRYRQVLYSTLEKMRESLRELENRQVISIKQKVKIGLRRGLAILRKVLPRLLLAMVIVILLVCTGAMNYLAAVLDPALRLAGLSHTMVIVIIAQSTHYMTGMYVAATLYSEGQLTVKQLIISLLIGALIRSIIIHLRAYLPVRSAFFTFNVALKWTLLDIATSVLTCILAILLVQVLL